MSETSTEGYYPSLTGRIKEWVDKLRRPKEGHGLVETPAHNSLPSEHWLIPAQPPTLRKDRTVGPTPQEAEYYNQKKGPLKKHKPHLILAGIGALAPVVIPPTQPTQAQVVDIGEEPDMQEIDQEPDQQVEEDNSTINPDNQPTPEPKGSGYGWDNIENVLKEAGYIGPFDRSDQELRAYTEYVIGQFYTLRGTKKLEEIRQELKNAGYPNWNTDSTYDLLRVYDKTVSAAPTPSATPIPTPEPKANIPSISPLQEFLQSRGLKERPMPRELPKDIVSPEELREKYNITIVSTKDVQMYIRKSAFELDPFFRKAAEMKRYKSVDPNNPAYSATIILVDNDVCDAKATGVPEDFKDRYLRDFAPYQPEKNPGYTNGGFFVWDWRYWGGHPQWDIKDLETGKTLEGSQAKHQARRVYIPVGKHMKPTPKLSPIHPDNIERVLSFKLHAKDYWQVQGKHYVDTSRDPFITARHETGHELDTDSGDIVDELKNDMQIIGVQAAAAENWLKTGDDSALYIVFLTSEGVAIG